MSIGHLEEEAPLRLQEAVGRHILLIPPGDLLVERSVADVNHSARDVGERGQKIGHHPPLERPTLLGFSVSLEPAFSPFELKRTYDGVGKRLISRRAL
jgi:hypothetical protein